MKTVLLGRGADRQYRGRTVIDAPRDLVPHHALDEIAFGVRAHAFRPFYYAPTKHPSEVLR